MAIYDALDQALESRDWVCGELSIADVAQPTSGKVRPSCPFARLGPGWGQSMTTEIKTSDNLRGVRYEIRGQLAQRAHEMERQGSEIISMNIGNPGLFGFRTPETMRMAMIENLPSSEAYCHQKGIFPAREAVVMQHQERGVMNVTA